MGHGTEQHLEHAEHAAHAAHDPFDRRVAMAMAIMAAVLAGVTMISHRGHNEVLRLQSEANINITEASNRWNYYQAKNNASRQVQNFLMMAETSPRPEGAAGNKLDTVVAAWVSQVDKYEGKGYWAQQVKTNFRGDKIKGGEKIKGGDLEKRRKEAQVFTDKADELKAESHHVHENVNWLDYGHLGLELALVLSAVTLLSKQKSLWYLGIAVAVIGACLAMYGVYGLYLTEPMVHSGH